MPLSWLHVEGNKIKDSTGNLWRGTSAAFGGLGESGSTYWNGGTLALQTMMLQFVSLSKGKANVIRVCTGIGALAYTPIQHNIGWNEPYAFDAAIDDIVALASQYDIRIIIEFHGGLSQAECTRLGLDPTDIVNWFSYFVNRYKDNPVVAGFEIYNEPFAPSFGGQTAFVNMVTAVANAIRVINPNALILIPSAFDGFNFIGQYWIQHPVVGNAVYTWDWYYKDWGANVKDSYQNQQWTQARALTAQSLQMAYGAMLAANHPVWCSEIGWFGDYAPAYPDARCEPEWRHQMADCLDIMNQDGTNYYVWWWWSNPGNYGLADQNFSILSPQGEVWANALTSAPTPPPPTDNTLTAVGIGAAVAFILYYILR